jgi:hypothetical protein
MVLRHTTSNLPDDLVARANAYVSSHGTTVTAIIREHLETKTAEKGENRADDPLRPFSDGRLTKDQAVKALGLRDYAELLVAVGDAGLELPMLPAHEIENQAARFAEIWRQA